MKDNKIKNISDNDIISDLLTKIYLNKISLNEIEEQQIDKFKKIILEISYYEKNNKKEGIKFIREQKNLYNRGDKKFKILNILLERLITKKVILYDVDIYKKYLNCNFNFELGLEISKDNANDKKQENTLVCNPTKSKIIKENNNKKMKKEAKKPNIITSDNINVVPFKKKIVKGKIKEEKEILIKDLFEKEILQIGSYLYLKMSDYNIRKDAIKAWDNLQILIEKSVYDKEALIKMISFLDRIKDNDKFDFGIDEKRYSKYLK